jgi:hypothetical protein
MTQPDLLPPAPAVLAERLRPLPRTATPLHQERWLSYLGRLAAANRLSFGELHRQLDNPARLRPAARQGLSHALSDLSGQPRDRLLRAIPDMPGDDGQIMPPGYIALLEAGKAPQHICSLCAAGKGATQAAEHWVPATTFLCLRHQRWTAVHEVEPQFTIADLPELLPAQRRMHRLLRRHGWRTTIGRVQPGHHDLPSLERQPRLRASLGEPPDPAHRAVRDSLPQPRHRVQGSLPPRNSRVDRATHLTCQPRPPLHRRPK